MNAEQSLPGTQRLLSHVIEPAQAEHVSAIAELVNEHARRGDMLPRAPESIAVSLSDWLVGLVDGQVVACGALYHYNGSLVEVRSVAVADAAKGHGWGSAMVRALLELVEERRVPTVFTLTRAVHFFARLGFSITDKSLYPLKVWKDCQICPLQDHCDETAMTLQSANLTTRPLRHGHDSLLESNNGHGAHGADQAQIQAKGGTVPRNSTE